VLPLLRIVTETGFRVPSLDLGVVIRHVCETYWIEGGGTKERLNLHLETLMLDLDRARLLVEAVRALLIGGLSPGFSPRSGEIGVHLWSLDGPDQVGTLLIADNGMELLGEPSTASTASARQFADRAGCALTWQSARGAVWRILIPAHAGCKGHGFGRY
jgi:hypothetical protein